MLGLNKKFGSIILGVILMLGVASLAYAFSFQPTVRVFDREDVAGNNDCYGQTMPTPVPPAIYVYGYNGWDIDEVGLRYYTVTDTLHIGISMHNGVIAGDVENNGDPGGTHICLGGWPAEDHANLGGPTGGSGEAIDFIFDADDDGTYDYIAGVSRYTDIAGITVAYYVGSSPPPIGSGVGYGDTVTVGSVAAEVTNNPSTANPDLEFMIYNFSSLRTPGPGEEMLDFDFVVRAGSTKDAGTGEDIVRWDWNPTVVTLSSLTARSSAGGSASGLWLGLAGLTVLAAGSLLWAKRWAG
jgi:hypothetical protein